MNENRRETRNPMRINDNLTLYNILRFLYLQLRPNGTTSHRLLFSVPGNLESSYPCELVPILCVFYRIRVTMIDVQILYYLPRFNFRPTLIFFKLNWLLVLVKVFKIPTFKTIFLKNVSKISENSNIPRYHKFGVYKKTCTYSDNLLSQIHTMFP